MPSKLRLVDVLLILIVSLVYSVLIGATMHVAQWFFGRPRGVNYGIGMHILWIGLSLQGLVTAVLIRVISPAAALGLALVIIAALSLWLMPPTGLRAYVSVCAAAFIMTLAFGMWHLRRAV